MKRVWTEENIKYLRDNYASQTALQIAERLGVDAQQVYNKASKLGLVRKPYKHIPKVAPVEFAKKEEKFAKPAAEALPSFEPITVDQNIQNEFQNLRCRLLNTMDAVTNKTINRDEAQVNIHIAQMFIDSAKAEVDYQKSVGHKINVTIGTLRSDAMDAMQYVPQPKINPLQPCTPVKSIVTHTHVAPVVEASNDVPSPLPSIKEPEEEPIVDTSPSPMRSMFSKTIMPPNIGTSTVHQSK